MKKCYELVFFKDNDKNAFGKFFYVGVYSKKKYAKRAKKKLIKKKKYFAKRKKCFVTNTIYLDCHTEWPNTIITYS